MIYNQFPFLNKLVGFVFTGLSIFIFFGEIGSKLKVGMFSYLLYRFFIIFFCILFFLICSWCIFSTEVHKGKSSGLLPWPQRLTEPPPRLEDIGISAEEYQSDTVCYPCYIYLIMHTKL